MFIWYSESVVVPVHIGRGGRGKGLGTDEGKGRVSSGLPSIR